MRPRRASIGLAARLSPRPAGAKITVLTGELAAGPPVGHDSSRWLPNVVYDLH
jgi:hypothetical protein